MRYFILIVTITWGLHSCGNRNSNQSVKNKEVVDNEGIVDPHDDYWRNYMPDSLSNRLIESAIVNGDKDSYARVADSRNFMGPKLLMPALIMANKYKDPRACYDVFYMLCQEGYNSQSLDLGTLDSTTKTIGLYYLLKAHELGFNDATYFIEKLYLKKGVKGPQV
ncbi:MAG: hypothetical protein IPP99_04220 [Chitinophagaceae bacterium]|nr:hypothetical protein [Chitinophagaceae bacterium]